MGIFDFARKKKKKEKKARGVNLDAALEQVDTSQLSISQKMALKMFKRMSPEKQREALRKAMNPQRIQKEKDKILKQLDEAVKSGQMSRVEAEAVKRQLGLR